MSELSRIISTAGRSRHRPGGSQASTASIFNWSREGVEEILAKKINSRLEQLEKDGLEVLQDLGELSRRVETRLEDTKLKVKEKLGDKEDVRKSYREMSRVIVEAEDELTMLASDIARWKDYEAEIVDDEVTSGIGDNGKELINKPVNIGLQYVAEEEVGKENVEDMSGQPEKQIYQEVSQVIMEADDDFTMLAALNIVAEENVEKESVEGVSGEGKEAKNKGKFEAYAGGIVSAKPDERSTEKVEIRNPGLVSDTNNNIAIKEKAPGSVIVINNLDTKFMDCDRLFNLLSPYAQVQSIKFLKVSDFRKAMVELSSKEGAQRVMKYIREENVFGKIITIEPSLKLRVTEFKPSQLPPLPNGTKAFQDYSEEIRRNSMDYLRASMYPPSRTIYFCKTPKMSDDDFKDIFEKRKAPVPYKIMWFPSGGMGCLQFKTKEEAIKAICIANLVQAKNGRIIHLAFTFERKDSDFYIKKITKEETAYKSNYLNKTGQSVGPSMDFPPPSAGLPPKNIGFPPPNVGVPPPNIPPPPGCIPTRFPQQPPPKLLVPQHPPLPRKSKFDLDPMANLGVNPEPEMMGPEPKPACQPNKPMYSPNQLSIQQIKRMKNQEFIAALTPGLNRSIINEVEAFQESESEKEDDDNRGKGSEEATPCDMKYYTSSTTWNPDKNKAARSHFDMAEAFSAGIKAQKKTDSD